MPGWVRDHGVTVAGLAFVGLTGLAREIVAWNQWTDASGFAQAQVVIVGEYHGESLVWLVGIHILKLFYERGLPEAENAQEE